MLDDARPGFDDSDDLQTRLMTRRLARSESSPILVIPIASSRLATPARDVTDRARVQLADLPSKTPLPSTSTARSPSRHRSAIAVVIVAMAACAAGVCAGVSARERPRPVASGSVGTDVVPGGPTGIAPATTTTTTGTTPAGAIEVRTFTSAPAPPTTGLGERAAPDPLLVVSLAPHASSGRRLPARAGAASAAGAPVTASARTAPVAAAAGDDLADAKNTARLASDEVAAALH